MLKPDLLTQYGSQRLEDALAELMIDSPEHLIPKDIFEAAIIDGATRLSTFFRITLPLLWDTIQTAWVYLAIMALDAYALVAVMTAGPGGPDNSTQVMALQIADNGFCGRCCNSCL